MTENSNPNIETPKSGNFNETDQNNIIGPSMQSPSELQLLYEKNILCKALEITQNQLYHMSSEELESRLEGLNPKVRLEIAKSLYEYQKASADTKTLLAQTSTQQEMRIKAGANPTVWSILFQAAKEIERLFSGESTGNYSSSFEPSTYNSENISSGCETFQPPIASTPMHREMITIEDTTDIEETNEYERNGLPYAGSLPQGNQTYPCLRSRREAISESYNTAPPNYYVSPNRSPYNLPYNRYQEPAQCATITSGNASAQSSVRRPIQSPTITSAVATDQVRSNPQRCPTNLRSVQHNLVSSRGPVQCSAITSGNASAQNPIRRPIQSPTVTATVATDQIRNNPQRCPNNIKPVQDNLVSAGIIYSEDYSDTITSTVPNYRTQRSSPQPGPSGFQRYNSPSFGQANLSEFSNSPLPTIQESTGVSSYEYDEYPSVYRQRGNATPSQQQTPIGRPRSERSRGVRRNLAKCMPHMLSTPE